MNEEDELSAAHYLRGQQQARFKTQVDAFAQARKGNSDMVLAHLSGFLAKPADALVALENALASADSVGEFDEPLSHTVVTRLCLQIEGAAAKLEMPLHSGVSASSIMQGGFEAMQQRVMMTNASVVMLTPSLLLLCNRVGKLIARSSVIGVKGDQAEIAHDIESFRMAIQRDPKLLEDWMQLFYDSAYDADNPSPGRLYGLSGEGLYVWSLVRDAMELFAVGHEYGHHIAQHTLGGEISSGGEERARQHAKEMEADLLGAVLSGHAGADDKVPNTYAMSGAGAVILLIVLEYSRRARHVLLKGVEQEITRNTHPPLEVRLATIDAAIDSVAPEAAKEGFRELRARFIEMLGEVWEHAKRAIVMMHERGVRPVKQDVGWLPDQR
jgi:hypothetical protein